MTSPRTSVSATQLAGRLCPWAPLWSELHGLDVAPREEANAPTEAAPQPVRVQVL